MTQISYLGVDWILILLFRKLKVYNYTNLLWWVLRNQKKYNQIETLCALNLKFEFTLYHAQYNTHAGSNQTDCKNH